MKIVIYRNKTTNKITNHHPVNDRCTEENLRAYNENEEYPTKVEIVEFICDSIEVIACHKYHNGVGYDYIYYTESKDTLTNETQLTDYDMQQYFGCAEDGESVGYAWHISDLKIYDKPKELGEFSIRKKCTSCKRSGYESTACMYDEDCIVPVPLTRPPQSWRYIEEITDDE